MAREYHVANHFEEARDNLLVSCRRARANQSLSFPIVSPIAIVVGGALDRPNKIAVAAVRAQPQVYPVHRAFLGASGNHLDDTLGNACEEFLVADRR